MKTYVDKETFVNTFDRFGRSEQFTRAAREALFEYYEQLEEDLGEDIEFDCIAICCDWSEYDSAVQACLELSNRFETTEGEDDDEQEARALEFLRDETQVIEFDGGILVQSF